MSITLNGTTGIISPKVNTLDLELDSKNVVERGSNANGEYVRFADGTQICTQQSPLQSVAVGAVAGFTFINSAAFVGVPRSFFTRTSDLSALDLRDGMENHSINGATVFVYNTGPAGTRQVVVFYLAIGRWY